MLRKLSLLQQNIDINFSSKESKQRLSVRKLEWGKTTQILRIVSSIILLVLTYLEETFDSLLYLSN